MTTTKTTHIIAGITPQVIDPAEQFIILQTPAAQAVAHNSLQDTRKHVSIQSEVDGISYVCRIFNWTANTMHYIFKQEISTIDGKHKPIYLLDDHSNATAYCGDDLFNAFNAIVNESDGVDSVFLELYTDSSEVESDFRLWAEGKEEQIDERPDVEDDFRY